MGADGLGVKQWWRENCFFLSYARMENFVITQCLKRTSMVIPLHCRKGTQSLEPAIVSNEA